MTKNAFYFILKDLFFLRIFNFLSCLSGHVEKQLDQKDKIISKSFDLTTWITYRYNAYSAQYLTKQKQSTKINLVSSQNISREKVLFKNHAQNKASILVPDLFLFFKIALHQAKASGLQRSFKIYRQPLTQHTIKISCIKLQTIDPNICPILTFQKRVWKQFLHHILFITFQDKFSWCYILLTDQILLPGSLYFLKYWAICVL